MWRCEIELGRNRASCQFEDQWIRETTAADLLKVLRRRGYSGRVRLPMGAHGFVEWPTPADAARGLAVEPQVELRNRTTAAEGLRAIEVWNPQTQRWLRPAPVKK